jgi:hypothetical protein
MRSKPRLRDRHGTVVAYLALFVALGGTSYAVSQLPPGSVGTKQLKDSAVTGPKIKAGTITGGKIHSFSINPLQLAAGTAAKNLKVTVRTEPLQVPASHASGVTAFCKTGQAVAGGGKTFAPSGVFMTASVPVKPSNDLPNNGESFKGWQVGWENHSDKPALAINFVVCLA